MERKMLSLAASRWGEMVDEEAGVGTGKGLRLVATGLVVLEAPPSSWTEGRPLTRREGLRVGAVAILVFALVGFSASSLMSFLRASRIGFLAGLSVDSSLMGLRTLSSTWVALLSL